MEFDFDGSLKNAIAGAGEAVRAGSETDRYLLCDVRLEDGRFAQAHLVITSDSWEKMETNKQLMIIDLMDGHDEKAEVPNA